MTLLLKIYLFLSKRRMGCQCFKASDGVSVKEVAHSRKDHRDAQSVGGCDDFGIADGAAGRYYVPKTGFIGVHDAVIEREERVGRHDTFGKDLFDILFTGH